MNKNKLIQQSKKQYNGQKQIDTYKVQKQYKNKLIQKQYNGQKQIDTYKVQKNNTMDKNKLIHTKYKTIQWTKIN